MRYFFVGIGGVSMSALAKLLWHQGHTVVGSDAVASANTKDLQALGITVYIGHNANHVHDVERLVINGAITEDNPELQQARQAGIKVLYREEVLAQVARNYDKVLAVAGCHGKSSTTAMLGAIFTGAGVNPTVHNGAQDNLRLGGQKFFITEACEFRKSFLKLQPTMAVVTNVDRDHLDCYRDLADIQTCFRKFAQKAAVLIKNADDVNSVALQGRQQTLTFGLYNGHVHTKNLQVRPGNCYRFDLVIDPRVFGVYWQLPKFELHVPGQHNVYNALAAITAALWYGFDLQSIKTALAAYRGIARRFEPIGKIQNTPVILDYAHHPREIATTLATAQTLYRHFLLVFQPHTFTRTLALWNDFVAVLSPVKHLVLYKTYAARGKVIKGGRALDLSRQLHQKYIANTKILKKYLQEHAAQFDAIILCGAGDVVSGDFLREISLLTSLD